MNETAGLLLKKVKNFWYGKLQKDFGTEKCCFYTLNFWSLPRDIFGHRDVTFPYTNLLSFFDKLLEKVVGFCYSDSFVQKANQQSDARFNVTSDSQVLYKLFKTRLFFLQTQSKKIMWAMSAALATTMPRCAFHPIPDITFYCWVMLKRCYRNWIHCFSHINTWTVSMNSSSIDSAKLLLSRRAKCLIMCKKQPV